MQFHDPECGLLPLANRFVRLAVRETVWIVPVADVIPLACKYYEVHGWREPEELKKGERQPTGKKLARIVEVNGNLAHHATEEDWSRLKPHARLVSGTEEPPDWEEGWWFEEQGGSVEAVTDLPLADQKARPLLWFSEAWKQEHKESA
jgi:hypothetical protein